DRVAALRRRLGPGGHVASTAAAELGAALEKLHGMPPFRGLGGLNSSSHRYGTGRLLGDAATITGYQKGMLLLGRPVQILDVPSLQLPAPGVDWQWAAYNPSFVLVRWRGKSVILVAYRMSTWNLCTWAGDGSPLERLPVVKGKRRTTSKVVAAILRPDFAVVVPPRPVVGTNYSSPVAPTTAAWSAWASTMPGCSRSAWSPSCSTRQLLRRATIPTAFTT
ncbi:unnamed protein product, partial [Prorocentrum cordatum]